MASLLATRSSAISNFGVTLCLGISFAIQAQGQVKAQAPQAIPQQFEGVDSFIRNEMAKQHIPGISVSVISRGKVIYEKGYGVADSADGVTVNPETPFYTASVTKAFTGTSLILLESEHKLDLDRPANDYLRSAKLQSPMWDVSAATVRRVANHTGGLTTYNRKCNVGDSTCQPSTMLAIERHGILFWSPGDHFDYSNIGYGVLGAIISNISGKPFAQFLQQELFEPLEMDDCYLQTRPQLVKGSSLNYDPNTLARTPLQISDTPGASSLRCSSHDLAIFGSFILGKPLAGQKQLLSGPRLQELLYSDSASAGEKYSFGWDQNRVDGYPGVFAQGGTYDSFALLQLIPEQEIAIAVLANTGTTLPFEITNRIVKQVLPVKPGAQTAEGAVKHAPAAGPLLSGIWSGQILLEKSTVPVTLDVVSAQDVKATIGKISSSCMKIELSSSRLDCIAGSDLRSDELPAGSSKVELEVYFREGLLVGAATTQGSVQLPFWISLKPVAK